MMKINIEFLQTGGVPLTNDLMDTLQQAYSIFNVLGDVAGNLTILSGCNVIGNSVSDGIVVINGDIMPFEGGVISSTVYVNTQQITKTFQDQTDKVLIEKKSVKFGLSTETYNWTDFVRLETLKAIQDKVNNSVTQQQLNALIARVEKVELKTAPIINGGIVLVWRRPLSEIPVGWKECSDLRGKTVVGLDPNDPDFNILGGSFGSKMHTLTIDEIPNHSHTIFFSEYPDAATANPGYDGGSNHYQQNVNKQTTSVGGSEAHNNVQPSMIAYYIEPNFQ